LEVTYTEETIAHIVQAIASPDETQSDSGRQSLALIGRCVER
jgi:hypothetical protein